jgi:toxin HigB-1
MLAPRILVVYRLEMRIEFADAELVLIETDEAGSTRLPVAVIKSARRKLTVLRAAIDDRSLRNWKSLHYEKLRGDREGQRSIRLNDQYRMVFELDEETEPQTATILKIEDYH